MSPPENERLTHLEKRQEDLERRLARLEGLRLPAAPPPVPPPRPVAPPPAIRLARVHLRVRRVRRGQAGTGDATLLYRRMLDILKRRGYQKPAWFTPYEFASSLPASELGILVTQFTSAYNALRFGGQVDAAPQLSALLEELERQGR